MIGNVKYSLFNQTYDQCICEMSKLNGLVSALNYFSSNQTCQLFDYNISSVLIKRSLNSTFIFINQSSIEIINIESYTRLRQQAHLLRLRLLPQQVHPLRLPQPLQQVQALRLLRPLQQAHPSLLPQP
ncbi:unnamed protein product [Adineta steineri]|uniref:Uncharacterized protein n=1 Tax=Adineta steineri TaxID=433720 RepID=A0A814CHA3_9BILA|nr:unnamed protein product [Adineta steineri]